MYMKAMSIEKPAQRRELLEKAQSFWSRRPKALIRRMHNRFLNTCF
jgi:hypothetical protein